MRHYLLAVQQPGDGSRLPPAELEPIIKEVEAVNEELRASGAWVFAGGLHPVSATTVVRHDGTDFVLTDGPYIEGKEHLGGLTVLAADDLDEALRWARKFAKATRLPIEVRPFHGDPATHLP
ncbi:YciI family protein [Asanoa siamensis]|uniref:YCII-related domain-containing protein n=1 Tax=Asanoa siamensis TaxID=926357 RepID=A0ABQ4CQR9_9ACTN|nr:YciI family protein [Asanoa siamensis]GIF73630.1 hypothetical protein Asi02nite_31480 [Asanoa siamensis]